MEEIIQDVVRHATEAAPHECCGLVVKAGDCLEYVRCKNIATDSEERFVIAPEEYAEVEDRGEIVMIAHSHVYKPPVASEADKVGCEKSNLPWLIVNYPVGNYEIIKPAGYRAPLLGRPFCKGSLDCYELIRDYYAVNLGIDLPDCYRPEVWFEEGRSLPLEHYASFGFVVVPIEELQPNDLILMRVGASVTNHCALYIGDNLILHHLIDRISSREVYGGFWRKVTTHVLRYVGRPE